MHEVFIGEKCPVCHRIFLEDDDIVVCPQCGAPYHRECYKHVGKCEFKDKHGSFEWVGEKQQLKEHFENIETADIKRREDEGGKEIPEPDFSEIHSMEEYKEFMDSQLLKQERDFKPDDGVTAEELLKFIGKNAYYYFPTFAGFARKGKIVTLNFAAMLFFPLHCFYRRMNLLGTITTLIYMALMEGSLLLGKYLAVQGFDSNAVMAFGLALCCSVTVFLLLFFNYFYYKTALKKIRTVKEQNASLGREEILKLIAAEGKPSLFNSVVFAMCVIVLGLMAMKLLNNYLAFAQV